VFTGEGLRKRDGREAARKALGEKDVASPKIKAEIKKKEKK